MACAAITTNTPDLASYDYIIVAMSGGKDSLACMLELFERGVDPAKVELWHHDIDGREGSTLMDWPVTRDYCQKVADAFGVPIYFSWKVGGFEREMLRDGALTSPTSYEVPRVGVVTSGGVKGKLSTRRKFPQVAADLSVRWCSAYLKIDVCRKAIAGQGRFEGKRTLLLTGERAEESANRARYKQFEDHATNGKKRTVHQWRPVHQWSEQRVWDLIEKYKINPHPAYRLGWGRVSCAACIFGSKDQWASLNAIAPNMVRRISEYEVDFECTINRSKSVPQLVAAGTPYAGMLSEVIMSALSTTFEEAVIVEEWTLPSGAFGESCGPT
jgi:hypothetical protein